MREALAFGVLVALVLVVCSPRQQGGIDRRSRLARILSVAVAFVAVHIVVDDAARPERLLAAPGNGSPSSSSATGGGTHDAAYAAASEASLAAFYNLFVPHGDDAAANAIRVVEDQLGQVAESLRRLDGLAGASGKGEGGVSGVLLYNLIGNSDALPPSRMKELCRSLHPNLECHLLSHYRNATESVTLASLYDFCSSTHVSDPDRTRVAYLHSKGSYHSHGKQGPWRRALTEAALRPECLNPPDATCDICGAQYYTMFGSMFPGNMWTAKCSYVRKLWRPEEGGEYSKRKEESLKEFFRLQATGAVRNTMGWHQDVFYGLDRYQWEHWAGSHPSLVPCEVHGAGVGFWDMTEGKVDEKHFHWGMGPRRHMIFDKPGAPRPYLSNDHDANFRQYYYLAGNLIRWIVMYDEVPSQESWAWSHFPAGGKWKELVAKHGTDAVDAMVRESKARLRSAFVSDGAKEAGVDANVFREEDLAGTNGSAVVFYHISVPSGDEESRRAMDVVASQFDALSMGTYDNGTGSFELGAKTLVFYTVAGGRRRDVENLCREKRARIACQLLGVYETDASSGETLSRLHSFCKEMPDSDVVYISNRPSGDSAWSANKNVYDVDRINLATSAVLSKLCRPSGNTCNACGLEFYPLPYAHFAGNTFVASCDYIRSLLPPQTYEDEMYRISGDLFLARLRKRFTMELFELTPRMLGMKAHAMEHWIGSHPDLRPCDVGPASAEGSVRLSITEKMRRLSRSAAPRREGVPPGYSPLVEESQFRTKREVAFREYYYLAGNMFRWHALYGRVPDSGSWAWEWFPDGLLWKAAARQSGADAVDVIARHLNKDGGQEQDWVE